MIFDSNDSTFGMPHTKFVTEVEMLLKEFGRHYHKDDHAGEHSDTRTQATSSRITEFVKNHWRDGYRDLNFPQSDRRKFLPYKSTDPQGN